MLTTPGLGKFQGEPAYTPYLWNLALNGHDNDCFVDEGGIMVSLFYVDEGLRNQFDLPPETHAIVLWEDEVGFVNTMECHTSELRITYPEFFRDAA
jgi:hypothetical protein